MRWNLPGTHPLNDLVRNLWAACHLLAFRRSALHHRLPIERLRLPKAHRG